MRVHNVHERIIEAPAEAFGPLLERIGGPDDVLWPSPEWSPMVLDGPPRVGSAGGHGVTRYHVTAYEPGRRIEFRFAPGDGLDGTHTLTVEPLGPSRSRLRHVIDGDADGPEALRWYTAVRFAHDAVVEALLDRAEIALGTGPARPARLSPAARLLRWASRARAYETAVPDTELLATALPRVAWSDAYAVDCRPGLPDDPQAWTAAMFASPPLWVVPVLGLRQVLALLAGIELSRSVPPRPEGTTRDEVLFAIDRGSLDTRLSVLRDTDRVVVSTIGTPNDVRGAVFLALARHVHPFVVQALLTKAAATLARTAAPVPVPVPR